MTNKTVSKETKDAFKIVFDSIIKEKIKSAPTLSIDNLEHWDEQLTEEDK